MTGIASTEVDSTQSTPSYLTWCRPTVYIYIYIYIKKQTSTQPTIHRPIHGYVQFTTGTATHFAGLLSSVVDRTLITDTFLEKKKKIAYTVDDWAVISDKCTFYTWTV